MTHLSGSVDQGRAGERGQDRPQAEQGGAAILDAKGVAGEAGIRNGDLLLKMGKQSYETVTGFMRALRRRKPGDKIRLSVSSARGQARREVVFPLAELK